MVERGGAGAHRKGEVPEADEGTTSATRPSVNDAQIYIEVNSRSEGLSSQDTSHGRPFGS